MKSWRQPQKGGFVNDGPAICIESQYLPAQSPSDFTEPSFRDVGQQFAEPEDAVNPARHSAQRQLVSTVTPVYCGADYLHALAHRQLGLVRPKTR